MVETFRLKRQPDIAAKAIAHIITHTDQVTDFSEGSVIRSLVEAISSEIYNNNIIFADSIASSIRTAVKQAFNKPLLSASKAYGPVMFSRLMLPSPTVINSIDDTNFPGISFSYQTGNLPAANTNPLYYSVTGIQPNIDSNQSEPVTRFLAPSGQYRTATGKLYWSKQEGYSSYRIYRASVSPTSLSNNILNADLITNSMPLTSGITFSGYTNVTPYFALSGKATTLIISSSSGTGPYTATLTVAGTTFSADATAMRLISGTIDGTGSLGSGIVSISTVTSTTVLQISSTAPITNGTLSTDGNFIVSDNMGAKGIYFYSITGIDSLGRESVGTYPVAKMFADNWCSMNIPHIPSATRYKFYRSASAMPSALYVSTDIRQTGDSVGSLSPSTKYYYSVAAQEKNIYSPPTSNYASFTGSISATTLTVTAITSGFLSIGQTIVINDVNKARITGYLTGSGGIGTYNIFPSVSAVTSTFMESRSYALTPSSASSVGSDNFVTRISFPLTKYSQKYVFSKSTSSDMSNATEFAVTIASPLIGTPGPISIGTPTSAGSMTAGTYAYFVSSLIKNSGTYENGKYTSIPYEIESEKIPCSSTVTVTSNQKVTVSWTATSDVAVTHYRVYRKMLGVDTYNWVDVAFSTTSISDTGSLFSNVSSSAENLSFASKITAISTSGTLWTITHVAGYQFPAGASVTLSGCTPNAYNGTYIVNSSSSGTSFTIANTSTPGTATVFGVVTSNNDSPRMTIKDSGNFQEIVSSWPTQKIPMSNCVSYENSYLHSGQISGLFSNSSGASGGAGIVVTGSLSPFSQSIIGDQLVFDEDNSSGGDHGYGGIVTEFVSTASIKTALTTYNDVYASSAAVSIDPQAYTISPLKTQLIYGTGTINISASSVNVTGNSTAWNTSMLGALFVVRNSAAPMLVPERTIASISTPTALTLSSLVSSTQFDSSQYSIKITSLNVLPWSTDIWPYSCIIENKKLASSLTTAFNGTYFYYEDNGIFPQLSSVEQIFNSFPTSNTAQLATGDLVIPAGTIVRVPSTSKTYSLADSIIMSSNSNYTFGTDTVVATSSGTSFNTAKNTITEILTTVYGIDSVTNTSAFANGTNNETEEEWTTRFEKVVKSLSRGTKESIEEGAKTAKIIDNAGYVTEQIVKSLSTETSSNNILLYVANGTSSSVSADLLSKCKTIIEGYTDTTNGIVYPGYKAAGIPVTIQSAAFQTQNFSISTTVDYGYKIELLSTEIFTTVSDYIDELDISDGFQIPTITLQGIGSGSTLITHQYMAVCIDDKGNKSFPSISKSITGSYTTVKISFDKPTNGPTLSSIDILKWNGSSWVYLKNVVYSVDSSSWYYNDTIISTNLNSLTTYEFVNPSLKYFQKSELTKRIMRIPGISSVTISALDSYSIDQNIIIPVRGSLLKLGTCEIR
ncbi:MAG: hypothetical protein EBR94_06255 [Bacteroidetes bacterium]|nr:hypothetical protein [Bacteroidota bacterium]